MAQAEAGPAFTSPGKLYVQPPSPQPRASARAKLRRCSQEGLPAPLAVARCLPCACAGVPGTIFCCSSCCDKCVVAGAVCPRRHAGDSGMALEDCQTAELAGGSSSMESCPKAPGIPVQGPGARSGQPRLIPWSRGLWTWVGWIIWVLAWRLQGLGSSISCFGRKLLNFVSKHSSELLLSVADLYPRRSFSGLGAGEQMPTPEPLGVNVRVRNAGISPPGKGLLLHFSCCHCYQLLGSHLQLSQGERSSGETSCVSSGDTWCRDRVAAVSLSLSHPSWPLLTEGKPFLCFSSPSLTPPLLLPCPSTFHLLFPLTPPSPRPCSNMDGSGSFLSRGYRNNPRFCRVSVFPQGGLEKCIFMCSYMRTRDGGSGLAAGVNTGCIL